MNIPMETENDQRIQMTRGTHHFVFLYLYVVPAQWGTGTGLVRNWPSRVLVLAQCGTGTGPVGYWFSLRVITATAPVSLLAPRYSSGTVSVRYWYWPSAVLVPAQHPPALPPARVPVCPGSAGCRGPAGPCGGPSPAGTPGPSAR